MSHTIEEAYEVADAIDRNAMDELQEELGDLLFVTTILARHAGIDPETALHHANDKYFYQFRVYTF